MRVAIPLAQGKLSLHFGHCDQFAIFEIDDDNRKIIGRDDETPPAHAPGVLPQWLHGIGVNVIIAGGMGQRAQQLFAQNEIEVVIGAQVGTPEELVAAYLQNAGYNIYPVNPKYDSVLDQKCYPNLNSIPVPVEIINIFRNAEHIAPIVEEAIKIGGKVIWMQLGIINEDAAMTALESGMQVVMDRCMKIEHRRYSHQR